MLLKVFGRNPSGELLKKIRNSPNYKGHGFENISPTEITLESASTFDIAKKFINKNADARPSSTLPTLKTDLKNLNRYNGPEIIWFGHSSYFILINNKTFLIDPVFSGHASPFPFIIKSFKGSDIFSANDMPTIDYLLLTHDHYDHLDYETIIQIKSKVKAIYCPLGLSSHLIYWGIDEKIIRELDWWESSQPANDLTITAAPARHFSGRTSKRFKTLWSSFILKAGNYSLYLGGDSGYDVHFKTIGEKYGPFDISILESGQYFDAWPLIHMKPEQTVQAAIDLKSKLLLPVHWGKFSLALHPWTEPIKRVLSASESAGVNVTTPMIGETVLLDASTPQTKWWEKV